jgi:dTDP-4-dehydrorhamnose 3,5-epimerase
MRFKIRQTKIPGCLEILPQKLKDKRGFFVKTFHKDMFRKYLLETDFVEEYYSFSYKRVLRGLHFQVPPMDHVKLVYCISGKVLDVVVDLRIGSPTYGEFEMFDLSSEKANMIYIPKGLAHGFYVLSDNAIMVYKVSTFYSPEHDTGILWNSVGIPWPDEKPIISKRDSEFLSFKDFKSPFFYIL